MDALSHQPSNPADAALIRATASERDAWALFASAPIALVAKPSNIVSLDASSSAPAAAVAAPDSRT